MSIVGSKRFQQGIFEALASQNRAAGSGGGSGLQVMSILVNGGTQTGGPITGSATPTGLSGVGGEKTLTTATFGLARPTWVRLEAICSDYVTTAVAHVNAHPVYFQIDGVSEASVAYGFIPVFTNGDAEIRAQSTTIVKNVYLQPGSHTVNVIWNSEEGANDTCTNSNNPLYVYQLGS